jgi:hypothetical protein
MQDLETAQKNAVYFLLGHTLGRFDASLGKV